MRIASVGRALPPNRCTQEAIRARLERLWADRPSVAARLPALHANVRVDTRHLVLPLDAYLEERTFGQWNDLWIEHAHGLGVRAVRDALERAGLEPEDVDAIYSVSVTGLCSPSLEARLAPDLGLRPDVKRNPIFGLGCVAGVAGIARAADYVRAFPDQVAVLLSVELCSLTWQRGDTSVANLIATGLFGDGAAAVVLVGEERARRMGLDAPRVRATRSVLYPRTEHVMGWSVSERGFDLVLSPEVPAIAKELLPADVDRFLGDHGLARADVGAWVCHPGGPKVLQGMADGLELGEDQVRRSWEVLAEMGNLSSTSVLMVLERLLGEADRPRDVPALLVAMGPGFCSELVLVDL